MARKPSIGTKYTKLKNTIMEYLRNKGVYEETDEFQVDELVFNMKLADDAKEDIKIRGLYVGEEGWRANPSVNIYMNTIKNINAIGTRLGITVQERKKLNLTNESVDELDELIG